ncbi:MAG: hypothetical protein LBN33_05385 [Desulfovibrio sp.]|jgi:hypothetical protein|nr:hypothetical protein [Desulfovibrio sp.]
MPRAAWQLKSAHEFSGIIYQQDAENSLLFIQGKGEARKNFPKKFME